MGTCRLFVSLNRVKSEPNIDVWARELVMNGCEREAMMCVCVYSSFTCQLKYMQQINRLFEMVAVCHCAVDWKFTMQQQMKCKKKAMSLMQNMLIARMHFSRNTERFTCTYALPTICGIQCTLLEQVRCMHCTVFNMGH